MKKGLKSFINKCKNKKPVKSNNYDFLGIQITTSCPVGCSHCIFSCREKGEDMPDAILLKIINEWREYSGSKGVSLTGGEPFYRMNLLKKGVERANALNLKVRVVTSAFWATSYQKAFNILMDLNGISELAISIDRYHQKIIPPNHIITAFEAAKDIGINVYLLVTSDEKNLENDLEPFCEYLGNIIQSDNIRIFTMLHLGRAIVINNKKRDKSALEACGGMEVPFINMKSQLFYCCVPSSTGTLPNLLFRGCTANKPFISLFENNEDDYWLIQTLRAGGPDLLARGIGYIWPEKIDEMPVCDRCLHLLNNFALYEAVCQVSRNHKMREDVAVLLYNRGDMKPLTRYLCEKIMEKK